MPQLSDMRKDYGLSYLEKSDMYANPFDEFKKWFDRAVQAGVPEPNAMSLATVNADNGQPSLRIVLLKGFDNNGFVFFTNYESRKGQEITALPKAALNFFWGGLEQQIRIEGEVETIEEDESEAYFCTRNRESKIGAWASPQSQIIESRKVLEDKIAHFEYLFEKVNEIPLPSHWGGYRVIPNRIEFWQGRSNRLHDRITYLRQDDGSWEMVRLAP